MERKIVISPPKFLVKKAGSFILQKEHVKSVSSLKYTDNPTVSTTYSAMQSLHTHRSNVVSITGE